MTQPGFILRNLLRTVWFFIIGFIPRFAVAQQTNISDFVLFGGSGPCATCAVNFGSSVSINGGSTGSYKTVKSTGNTFISGNIFSGGTINLANGNTVNGRITAANSPTVTGSILSVGTGALLKGNIDIQGNIVVSGGTVSGKVTHPAGTTYTGPTPALGNVTGTPSLPTLPQCLLLPISLPRVRKILQPRKQLLRVLIII